MTSFMKLGFRPELLQLVPRHPRQGRAAGKGKKKRALPLGVRSTSSEVQAAGLLLQEKLAQVELEIERGKGGNATQIVKQLKQEGLVQGFEGARLVPKRSYTLEELRLNKIEPSALLSPKENYLDEVSSYCQKAYVSGLLSAYFIGHWDFTQVFYLATFSLLALTVDKVGYNGGLETLAVDTIGRWFSKSYGVRVSRHEAGHFFIAYIMGTLPSGYTLSAWSALFNNRTLNLQAGTAFCDDDFQKEVESGKLSSTALDRFCCIALAGVAQEYLDHGKAEGGSNDIMQLDYLLQGLGFTQKKADDQIRWSALNTVLLLRQHTKVVDKLAASMASGASLSKCILEIEKNLEESSVKQ